MTPFLGSFYSCVCTCLCFWVVGLQRTACALVSLASFHPSSLLPSFSLPFSAASVPLPVRPCPGQGSEGMVALAQMGSLVWLVGTRR